jgi:hypothetical protein
VRFFQLDPTFITDRVVPDLAKGIGICKEEIKQAIIYQSSDKKKRQAMDAKLNHRYPSRVRLNTSFLYHEAQLFTLMRLNAGKGQE